MRQVITEADRKLRPRCYEERLTDDEKTACSSTHKHMVYNEDADFGFFE